MDDPIDGGPETMASRAMRKLTGSALGVGFVLVTLPAALLFFGSRYLESVSLIGLPLLAIFGIMILFGTLALVAMLFQSLGLDDKRHPLALPEGSIRAAIALSLIVLFAIISIMLFQGMAGKPMLLDGLTEPQRNEMVLKFGSRVESLSEHCAKPPAAGAECAGDDRRFALSLRSAPGPESLDLAKQLLILVGTLMTSVTSYYFAARGLSGETRPPARQRDAAAGDDDAAAPAAAAAGSTVTTAEPEAHVDGCEVPIDEATPDDQLPAARGGVAPTGA